MAFFGAPASAAPAFGAPAPAAGGDDQAMDAEAAAIMRQEATAYDVLGVDPGADASAVRYARNERIRRWQTDRCNHSRATEVMQRINGAYESVSDDARRANYDESMARAARRRRAEDRERTPWIGATMRNGAYGRLMDLVARVDRDGVFGLTLPTIVVVGLESHGKSSLMERVALRDVFPRGVGFVTRMPIKLQLRQVNFENSVTIRLVRLSGSAWVPVEDSGPFYDIGQRNFAEVVAERMQRFISQRGQGSGNRQIAIDHRIEIEIRAADLVDIDLLDLPGIVSMPQDVAAASLQLTRDFLERDDTLALCVVEDLLSAVRSSLALGEIGRVEGLGARTIVVLTKVDMLTQQNPARLAHRLANPAETVGFEPTAFIPVINRGEHDGKSLTDALDAEEATFAEWKRTTPGLPADDRLGLTGVLNALNSLIEDHIRENWLPHQLDKATRRLQEVQEETASLGALSVSSELFLDRLCEVLSEQLAKLDGSFSSGLPSDIKVWSFDWMATLDYPANCEGAGRFDRVRRRMRAKANWKLIVESVPSEDLVRKLISLALSDSQLPVKMDRFDPSIGRTLYAHAVNNNTEIETLTNLGLPEHLNEPPHNNMPRGGLQFGCPHFTSGLDQKLVIVEEAKDAVLEHVFMPLVERSFWSGLPGLDLQESPESRARRNHLRAQEAALVRLIDGLTQFRDGQGFHPNAEAPAGDSGPPAGAGRAPFTGFSGQRRHPRGNPPQSPFGQSSSTFGGGAFGGAAPAPSGFGGATPFGNAAAAPSFGGGAFGSAAPAAASSPAFSFGSAAPAATASSAPTFGSAASAATPSPAFGGPARRSH